MLLQSSGSVAGAETTRRWQPGQMEAALSSRDGWIQTQRETENLREVTVKCDHVVEKQELLSQKGRNKKDCLKVI